MRPLCLICLITLFSLPAFSQYGRLEPLRDGDTSNVVMRTPKATLDTLLASKHKDSRRRGTLIRSVEKYLELSRQSFVIDRLFQTNPAAFANNVKLLESLGVNPAYYIQEFFVYRPRQKDRIIGRQQ